MFPMFNGMIDADFEQLMAPVVRGEAEVAGFNAGPMKMANATSLEEDELAGYVARSFKKQPGNYEISFETGFMEEHVAAFRAQAEKLLEGCVLAEHVPAGGLEDPLMFGQERAPLSIMKVELLEPEQRKQFSKDLEHEEKLRNFLSELADLYPKEVMDELVFLAHSAWEKYLSLDRPGMGQQELTKLGASFAEESAAALMDRPLALLNFREVPADKLVAPEQVEAHFSAFLEFYLTSLFLIIEGYFENPYGAPADAKRDRNFDDYEWDAACQSSLNDFSSPSKRVKFD